MEVQRESCILSVAPAGNGEEVQCTQPTELQAAKHLFQANDTDSSSDGDPKLWQPEVPTALMTPEIGKALFEMTGAFHGTAYIQPVIVCRSTTWANGW